MPLFLSGIWSYVIAAVASALLFSGGTFYITNTAKNLEIQKLQTQMSQQQAANVSASLNKLTSFIDQMHGASVDYQNNLAQINSHFAALQSGLAHVQTLKPLPVDCIPDIDRMHTLATAIAATNSATGP